MNKFLLACAVVFALSQGCKKKEDTPKTNDPVVVPTDDIEMKRISKHQWMIYKLELSGTDVWNNPLIVKDCERDDSYRFYKDSTLMKYENANICSGEADSTENTWQFYDGRKKIIGTLIGIKDTLGIVSLQDTFMQLSVDFMGNPALIYFKKK